jgi:hypothetical protein
MRSVKQLPTVAPFFLFTRDDDAVALVHVRSVSRII